MAELTAALRGREQARADLQAVEARMAAARRGRDPSQLRPGSLQVRDSVLLGEAEQERVLRELEAERDKQERLLAAMAERLAAAEQQLTRERDRSYSLAQIVSQQQANDMTAEAVHEARQRRIIRAMAHSGGAGLGAVGEAEAAQVNLGEYLRATGPVPAAVLLSQHAVKGYLGKRGKIHKNWNRRWFVFDLTKGHLAYFVKEDEHRQKGRIELRSVCKVFQAREERERGRRRFMVATPARLFEMEADSEELLVFWMRVIELVAI